MDFFKAKYITFLISFLLILGAGIGALLYYVFPQFYPQWYILILIYFLFVEVVIIYIIDAGSKKLDQRKLVNLYMSTRVGKVILSLVFIGVYSLAVKTGIKNFALVFMLFYLFSIAFETWYFINIERRIKAKNEKHESI